MGQKRANPGTSLRRLRQRAEFMARDAARRAMGRQPRHALAVCMCFKNSAPYLAEWIEFHRRVGVTHFFLYNNESSDGFLDVLRPYLAGGIVTLVDWPGHRQQIPIYDHCLRRFGPSAEWLAFIDDDEFLFTPDGALLPDRLRDYEASAGVQIPRWSFGSNGHRLRPPGLVIENYTRRAARLHENGKCVVRPGRVTHCINPHVFEARERWALVDENRRPGGRKSIAEPTSQLFRIHHYEVKSEEEEARKLARGKPNQERGYVAAADSKRAIRKRAANEVEDASLLQYAPALRKSLGLPVGDEGTD